MYYINVYMYLYIKYIYIIYIPKILNIKSFGNSTGNSYVWNPTQNTWSMFYNITESNI